MTTSSCRSRNFSTFALVLFFVIFTFTFIPSLFSAEETTRFGAVLIRAELATDDAPLPEIVFSEDDLALGWHVVNNEAYTGVDAHRFYFTIEAPKGGLSAPTLEVVWDGVEISRVIGAQEGYTKTEHGVRLVPAKRRTPTDAFTEVTFGSVRLGVFHNYEVRRAGPYRDGDYPANEIKAQLNYMLGALEVCRAYGWTDVSKPDFVDHVNLYGFETHFPNGHKDYPAHFHIMLAWDEWAGACVGHFLLNPDGSIIKNSFWLLHTDVERFYLPGEVCPFVDKTGREIFDLTVFADGSGVVFKTIGAENEYLIKAGEKTAVESVDVYVRPSDSDDAWKKVCSVKANDDSVNGVFQSTATYTDGSVKKVEFKYDPDTGAKL